MALIRSLVFSVLASVLATFVLRRILSVSGPPGGGERGASNAVVVVIPVVVGNSNNRIGWIKEVNIHRRHRRGMFGHGEGPFNR